MDSWISMFLIGIGLLMLLGGFGGYITIRFQAFAYTGLAGVFVMLIGIAGLIGFI